MKSILYGALALLTLVTACDRNIKRSNEGIGVVGPEVRGDTKGGPIDPSTHRRCTI